MCISQLTLSNTKMESRGKKCGDLPLLKQIALQHFYSKAMPGRISFTGNDIISFPPQTAVALAPTLIRGTIPRQPRQGCRVSKSHQLVPRFLETFNSPSVHEAYFVGPGQEENPSPGCDHQLKLSDARIKIVGLAAMAAQPHTVRENSALSHHRTKLIILKRSTGHFHCHALFRGLKI
jgi:hypothetical protein